MASRHHTFAASAFAISIPSLMLGITPAIGAGFAVEVSGYEYSLGSNCNLGGVAATCGVQFGGWTGGAGPIANGWRNFPGNGLGLWKANVNYLGKAAFGARVTLVGGSFDVMFVNGGVLRGVVASGAVNWPATRFADLGCGAGVAKVQVNVFYTRGIYGWGTFQACLQDLPVGTVVPPRIWGRLTQ